MQDVQNHRSSDFSVASAFPHRQMTRGNHINLSNTLAMEDIRQGLADL